MFWLFLRWSHNCYRQAESDRDFKGAKKLMNLIFSCHFFPWTSANFQKHFAWGNGTESQFEISWPLSLTALDIKHFTARRSRRNRKVFLSVGCHCCHISVKSRILFTPRANLSAVVVLQKSSRSRTLLKSSPISRMSLDISCTYCVYFYPPILYNQIQYIFPRVSIWPFMQWRVKDWLKMLSLWSRPST